jgi:hypothetical protein
VAEQVEEGQKVGRGIRPALLKPPRSHARRFSAPARPTCARRRARGGARGPTRLGAGARGDPRTPTGRAHACRPRGTTLADRGYRVCRSRGAWSALVLDESRRSVHEGQPLTRIITVGGTPRKSPGKPTTMSGNVRAGTVSEAMRKEAQGRHVMYSRGLFT